MDASITCCLPACCGVESCFLSSSVAPSALYMLLVDLRWLVRIAIRKVSHVLFSSVSLHIIDYGCIIRYSPDFLFKPKWVDLSNLSSTTVGKTDHPVFARWFYISDLLLMAAVRNGVSLFKVCSLIFVKLHRCRSSRWEGISPEVIAPSSPVIMPNTRLQTTIQPLPCV